MEAICASRTFNFLQPNRVFYPLKDLLSIIKLLFFNEGINVTQSKYSIFGLASRAVLSDNSAASTLLADTAIKPRLLLASGYAG